MVYVFLADGFEEIEALTTVDLLRRAKIDVKTVGIGNKIIIGSHGISVIADIDQNEIVFENIEMIILPGGMPGTLNLEKSEIVQKSIDFCIDNNIYIAAICAAPTILAHKGLLNNIKATCYPSLQSELASAIISDELVCVSDKIITGRGPKAAMEFSLKLVELLTSSEKANSIKEAL